VCHFIGDFETSFFELICSRTTTNTQQNTHAEVLSTYATNDKKNLQKRTPNPRQVQTNKLWDCPKMTLGMVGVKSSMSGHQKGGKLGHGAFATLEKRGP